VKLYEHPPDGPAVIQVPGFDGWVFSVGRDERSITVTPPEGETITARQWRAIPIGAILKAVSASRHRPWLALLTAEAETRAGSGMAGTRRPYGGSSQHRDAVAHVYREALKRGVKPQDAITAHFDVGEKTAERWTHEARQAGALGSYREERELALAAANAVP
jgi:hypothetical protein